MFVFLDESGIHKAIHHSSVALVYVADEDIELLESSIRSVEKRLGIEYFHWTNFGSKRGWHFRETFFREIVHLPFHFKYAIFENELRVGNIIEQALNSLLVERELTKIVIDGKQSKAVERSIKQLLRSKGIKAKKLRTMALKASPGLRLADALAGVTRSYYDHRSGLPRQLFELVLNTKTAHGVDGQETR